VLKLKPVVHPTAREKKEENHGTSPARAYTEK
jgi:hypothetical protein